MLGDIAITESDRVNVTSKETQTWAWEALTAGKTGTELSVYVCVCV